MSLTPRTSWPWEETLLHGVHDQLDADAVRAQAGRVLRAAEEKLPKVGDIGWLEELSRADELTSAAVIRV